MVGGRRAWAPGGDSDIVESVSRDVDRRLEENNPLWKRIWYNKVHIVYHGLMRNNVHM